MTTTITPPIANEPIPSAPSMRNANRAPDVGHPHLRIRRLHPLRLGFGNKLLELIQLGKGDAEGRFALTPVINYLLATLGFLCMFLWGAMRGTFHNVEGAKQRMLDDDQRIDEASRRAAI